MVAAAGQSGSPDAVLNLFFLRVVLSGLYSHMLFTGFVGFGFAYFVTRKTRRLSQRVGVLLGCIVLAWAAHFVWNSPWLGSLMARGAAAFAFGLVIKGLPFLSLLVILGVFADRREKRVFGCLMRGEVGSEAVSEGEFWTLRSAARRRKELNLVKRTKGVRAKAVYRRLMREQINLAVLHNRVASSDHPALREQREIIKALKAQLAAIPPLGSI